MKFSELSQSERRLVMIAGGLLLVILNAVLLKFFVTTHRQLKDALDQKTTQVLALRALSEQSELWEKRAQWVQKKQSKIENDAAEGNALLNALKENAARHGLTLSKQQLGSSRPEEGATSIPVQIELKGGWKEMCAFLIDLQGPEKWTVLQQARIRVDPSDATKMQGDLTVAKWFAPR